jgi:hypothetical protein
LRGEAKSGGRSTTATQASPAIRSIGWDARPYEGRYPCGSLVVDGVWHYGTYCLRRFSGDECGGVGWLDLGPFIGFRRSHDFGDSWVDTRHTPARPLFGESVASTISLPR